MIDLLTISISCSIIRVYLLFIKLNYFIFVRKETAFNVNYSFIIRNKIIFNLNIIVPYNMFVTLTFVFWNGYWRKKIFGLGNFEKILEWFEFNSLNININKSNNLPIPVNISGIPRIDNQAISDTSTLSAAEYLWTIKNDRHSISYMQINGQWSEIFYVQVKIYYIK